MDTSPGKRRLHLQLLAQTEDSVRLRLQVLVQLDLLGLSVLRAVDVVRTQKSEPQLSLGLTAYGCPPR